MTRVGSQRHRQKNTQNITKNNRIFSYAISTMPNIYLKYFRQRLQTKWGRLSPTQTAKVNCRLLSQYQ